MKIFYEILDKEVYIDIFVSLEDLNHLEEGRIISRDTIVPIQGDILFDRKVSVGIIAPQAKQYYDDIWDVDLEDEDCMEDDEQQEKE